MSVRRSSDFHPPGRAPTSQIPNKSSNAPGDATSSALVCYKQTNDKELELDDDEATRRAQAIRNPRDHMRSYFTYREPIEEQLERTETLHNRARSRWGDRKVVRNEENTTVSVGHGHELPATVLRQPSRNRLHLDDPTFQPPIQPLDVQRRRQRATPPAPDPASSATLVTSPKQMRTENQRACDEDGPPMASSRTRALEEGTGVQLAQTQTRFTTALSRFGHFVSEFGREQPLTVLRHENEDDEKDGRDLGKDDDESDKGGKRLPLQRKGKSRFKSRRKRTEAIVDHVAPLSDRKTFVIKYAKALLGFGAPTHRVEGQLQSAAQMLSVPAQFVHLPSMILISFGNEDNKSSEIVTVRMPAKLALGKLHRLHNVYRDVMHDEIGVNTGSAAIDELLKAPPQYSAHTRLALAYICSALICVMSFGGSFIDMWAAGLGGLFLAFFQNFVIIKYPMYSNVFELSVAVVVAFVARALSTIPGHLFCYSAVSSAGVVLILPGYIILCSALELGSKSMVCGSVRMVYAIVYALFLGFGLTIGSDFYYLVDPRARRQQRDTIALLQPVPINGSFTPDNYPSYDLNGVFSFTQAAAATVKLKGCTRMPEAPWYMQPFPFWTLFFLVPVYCTFASLWKGQPLISKHLPVMVLFACISYTANRVAKQWILDRGDVTSFIGAFILGILGNMYSRVFQGTAFTAMITGVVFLVPSSLGAGGGMSFTGDLFTEGIMLGLRMVQIAIGVTIGLFTSALVVYSFGTRKQTSIFGF